MNENHPTNSGLTSDEREIAARLVDAVENLQPNSPFVKKLEAELRDGFVAQKENRMHRFNFVWQSLAGTVAVAALTFLLVWLVTGVVPGIRETTTPGSGVPVHAVAPASTATPALPVYDRQGTTVYRAVDFPEAPSKLELYPYSASEQPATVESARALGQRLGMAGQVSASTDPAYRYQVSAGQQSLFVNSDRDFLYLAGPEKLGTLAAVSLEQAKPVIEAYLQAHGFDFKDQIQTGEAPGWFQVVALTPDGLPIYVGLHQPAGLVIALSADGKILQVRARLLGASGASLGKSAILSPKEAWQGFIDPQAWPGIFSVTSETLGASAQPALTIETFELVYYLDPQASASKGAYLQPVWRFTGQDSNGKFFECLLQALRP